jgi:hypothetical protein
LSSSTNTFRRFTCIAQLGVKGESFKTMYVPHSNNVFSFHLDKKTHKQGMSLIRTFVGYCVPHDETQWNFRMLIIVYIPQVLSPSTSSLVMCQKTHLKGVTCFFITWVRIDDLYVNLDVGNSTTFIILCMTWPFVFNYFVQNTHLMFVAKYNYCFL